jgi:hypothetical protein
MIRMDLKSLRISCFGDRQWKNKSLIIWSAYNIAKFSKKIYTKQYTNTPNSPNTTIKKNYQHTTL